jgi:metallo-beta-lactamase family protein
VHHLRHTLSDSRNTILITGYQATGTLGRQLLEGATTVEIYGDPFRVRAHVHIFNEFSAHADKAQLKHYVGQFPGVEQVMLVHGEPEQADVLRDELAHEHPQWDVVRPHEGETVTLL